jgi:hypothetical protein
VIFTTVAGEEQGLYGSTFLTDHLTAQGTDNQGSLTFFAVSIQLTCIGMVNNDIVSSPKAETESSVHFSIHLFTQGTPKFESPTVLTTQFANGGEADSPARQLALLVSAVSQISATNNENVYVFARAGWIIYGGDYESFLADGRSAIRSRQPCQDVRVENMMQFGELYKPARVGRVNIAALYSLEGAPGTSRMQPYPFPP